MKIIYRKGSLVSLVFALFFTMGFFNNCELFSRFEREPFFSKSLPKGSYLKSCEDCHFFGNILSCSCETDEHSWFKRRSHFIVNDCSNIINDHGELKCEKKIPDEKEIPDEKKEELPKGSYLKSCENCYFIGNVLSCECETDKYIWFKRRTTVTIDDCDDIHNTRGNLECVKEIPDEPKDLPEGSYLRSCKECSFEGDMLNCSCKNKGRWFNSSINPEECPYDIISYSGKLKCGDELPKGAYQDSCEKCTSYKGKLKCKCKGLYDGMSKWSRLSTKDCTYGIINELGELKCYIPDYVAEKINIISCLKLFEIDSYDDITFRIFKKSYRKLSRKIHPDHCKPSLKEKCHKQFIEMQECKDLIEKYL